jgi:hypothetical protein
VRGTCSSWWSGPCRLSARSRWPTSPAAASRAPGNSTIPRSRPPWTGSAAAILVIGTRFDPNTPLANARRAARRLGNAVLLIHDGNGHLSRRVPSTCVVQATGCYLVELTTPAPGTVCPSDRLPFDPEFGQPGS